MRTRTVLGLTAAWLLGGCIGAAGIEQGLRARHGELMYLRGAQATERGRGTVSVDAIAVDAALSPETTVRKTGGWAVPLLLVNLWKGEYQTKLGAAQLTNDWAAFVRESLAEDLRRDARYAVVEQGGDLRMEVRLSKVEMTAPVVEGGDFLFLLLAFSWSQWIRGGPVEVAIEGDVVVRRGGQEVLRKAVRGRSRSGALSPRTTGFDRFTADLGSAMIEALSLGVKSFNGAVVAELNELGEPAAALPADGRTRIE